MTSTVTMPLWLLIVILAFAAVTFASHFLFPSVRWFFRRRMEKVVARLNERLERPIQPFKLARRHDMIQRLIYDPEVSKAIIEHARQEGVPENVAFQTARSYAREIVPSFSASLYFGLAIKLAKLISTSLECAPWAPCRRSPQGHRPRCHGGICDEPPVEHGLCPRDLSGGRA